jgi:hypothetical protein
MTHFSTFRDWFWQFGIRLCSWPVGFPHWSAIAQKKLSSVTMRPLLHEGDLWRVVWSDHHSIFQGTIISCFQKTIVFYTKNTRGTFFLIFRLLHVLYYWHFLVTGHKSVSDIDTCFVGPPTSIEAVPAVCKFLFQWQAIHGRGLMTGFWMIPEFWVRAAEAWTWPLTSIHWRN